MMLESRDGNDNGQIRGATTVDANKRDDTHTKKNATLQFRTRQLRRHSRQGTTKKKLAWVTFTIAIASRWSEGRAGDEAIGASVVCVTLVLPSISQRSGCMGHGVRVHGGEAIERTILVGLRLTIVRVSPCTCRQPAVVAVM